MSKKSTRRLLQRRVLHWHPALLCFTLALLGSVYSGDVHLLNFGLKNKKVLNPQGRVTTLNIILII